MPYGYSEDKRIYNPFCPYLALFLGLVPFLLKCSEWVDSISTGVANCGLGALIGPWGFFPLIFKSCDLSEFQALIYFNSQKGCSGNLIRSLAEICAKTRQLFHQKLIITCNNRSLVRYFAKSSKTLEISAESHQTFLK